MVLLEVELRVLPDVVRRLDESLGPPVDLRAQSVLGGVEVASARSAPYGPATRAKRHSSLAPVGPSAQRAVTSTVPPPGTASRYTSSASPPGAADERDAGHLLDRRRRRRRGRADRRRRRWRRVSPPLSHSTVSRSGSTAPLHGVQPSGVKVPCTSTAVAGGASTPVTASERRRASGGVTNRAIGASPSSMHTRVGSPSGTHDDVVGDGGDAGEVRARSRSGRRADRVDGLAPRPPRGRDAGVVGVVGGLPGTAVGAPRWSER